MAEIRKTVAAVIRRWCPNVGAARYAVDAAWFEPDPVATAEPLADLPALFHALRETGVALSLSK